MAYMEQLQSGFQSLVEAGGGGSKQCGWHVYPVERSHQGDDRRCLRAGEHPICWA